MFLLVTLVKSNWITSLGLESGTVLDSQISASSYYGYPLRPWYGRLNNHSFWAAREWRQGEWLQIDFLSNIVAAGIKTQGVEKHRQYVTKVQIQTGTSESTLTPIMENGLIKVGIL